MIQFSRGMLAFTFGALSRILATPRKTDELFDEQAIMSRNNLRTQLEELRREKEQLEADNCQKERRWFSSRVGMTPRGERTAADRKPRGRGGRRTRSRRDGVLTWRTASAVRGYPNRAGGSSRKMQLARRSVFQLGGPTRPSVGRKRTRTTQGRRSCPIEARRCVVAASATATVGSAPANHDSQSNESAEISTN